jgi:hypothetical protein
MYLHQIGQHHGHHIEAGRGYELFKYINRFAEAAEAAGLRSPRTTLFRRLGEYVYRANRKANQPHLGTDEMGRQHGTADGEGNHAHSRGRAEQAWYMTDPNTVRDDQVAGLLREYEAFARETLPRLRALAQGEAPQARPGLAMPNPAPSLDRERERP